MSPLIQPKPPTPDTEWDPAGGKRVRIPDVMPGYAMVLRALRVVRTASAQGVPSTHWGKVIRLDHVLIPERGETALENRRTTPRPDVTELILLIGFEAEDDVGTFYDDLGGVHGRFDGEWDIVPVPPENARRFDLTFYGHGHGRERNEPSYRIRMRCPLPEVDLDGWRAILRDLWEPPPFLLRLSQALRQQPSSSTDERAWHEAVVMSLYEAWTVLDWSIERLAGEAGMSVDRLNEVLSFGNVSIGDVERAAATVLRALEDLFPEYELED